MNEEGNKQVFISYKSQNKNIADRICGILESNGYSCWIAPRDETSGKDYGGKIIDAVLKHFIPDPEKYFDELFINRLVWDDQNNLIDIIATDYDWDPGKKGVLGKCGGLKEICRKYKVPLEKSVFVGNDENDFMAMRVAGRKVYFSAQGIETAKTVEGVKIEQKNDLLAVAEYIIGKN